MVDRSLFGFFTTNLDNLSKKPFFFLSDSLGVQSGVLSGERNVHSNDETEEDLVCLPNKGPLAVAPEPSPLGVRNLCIRIRVCFLREFFPTTINEETRVKRTSFRQDLRLGSYLRPEWSRTGGQSQGTKPGDEGPPSACGMRFGFYLRLE